MKNNILQLHNQSERTVEKIDCPFVRQAVAYMSCQQGHDIFYL